MSISFETYIIQFVPYVWEKMMVVMICKSNTVFCCLNLSVGAHTLLHIYIYVEQYFLKHVCKYQKKNIYIYIYLVGHHKKHDVSIYEFLS